MLVFSSYDARSNFENIYLFIYIAIKKYICKEGNNLNYRRKIF